jgi:hypothetical protein
VASFGPLTIIRYGRHVLLSNKSTPEQHQEFLSRSAEANQRNCGVVYYQRGVRQSGGRNERCFSAEWPPFQRHFLSSFQS